MVLKQLSLEAASWPIFIALKKLKNAKKNLDQFAVSKLKLFQSNTKKFLLEVKFLYSYLDFQWPPFPNLLSYSAEISGQNGLHTAGWLYTENWLYSCYSWILLIFKRVAAHGSVFLF
jgi:hypothetical protein